MTKNKAPLYFIALVPDAELEKQVRELKEEIKEKYNSEKALRLPAHITLQIPFNMNEENEDVLTEALQQVANKADAQKLQLSGFGNFSGRVIYIDVSNPGPVVELHKKVQEALSAIIHIDKKKSEIHPHITIATRDLSRKEFQKAWPEFKERMFKASFVANSFTLFKHNGKTWDVLKKFSLDG
ncbi:2'-5' RNA ligase family protein [Salegentibacter sp. F188]|uniref:2'-5' RNA ligase family protein n=1 Tax=Autumnicola patrickiae TaxID=3075591 RepID=A0ABU3DXG4_9FLAO|nr:2'-5' RNA ligase family protein [Salegentibacter sp. F188]MDT0688395.1 2'-5' RNA ligase family protein [Salegentibacter sp. F188]